MLRSYQRVGVVAVAGASLLAAAEARAAIINFSTTGETETVPMSNGLDAVVTAGARSASVDLTPGVPTLVLLNNVDLEVELVNTAGGTDTLNQTLSITSPASTPASRALAQGIAVTTTGGVFGTTGSATIGPASALSFDLGTTGTLTVTPNGGSIVDTTQPESSFENTATFLLTAPIPEPAAGTMLLAGAGLLAARRPRRA